MSIDTNLDTPQQESNAQRRTVRSRFGKLRNWTSVLLLVPGIVLIIGFFGLPLGDVIIRSLSDPVWGIQNFQWLALSETNIAVAGRTFGTAFLVTVICLLLSYPYAYLMTICSERTRRLLTIFVMMPLWTSILVRTLAWMVLLQDSGPINDLLEYIGVGRIPLIRTTLGVALGMTQVLMPFMVLPLYSAMAKIDTRLLPAARSLGATPMTVFRTVYLPLSKPGIVAGSTTVFILGLGFYIIPSLLGSPRESMMATLIQQQIGGFLQWGHGAAMGIALLVVTVATLTVATRLAKGASIVPGVQR
ncbi:ABC transporter permease [Arthrobacter sp. S2(2024)]|jgi:putative spermidine/putrescine transport system permease protein|uniref:ABC transporter permease n=1 Tax=Arthrobacter sp. S2(2024) TaxID=3111911 RepID=UPI002FCACB85